MFDIKNKNIIFYDKDIDVISSIIDEKENTKEFSCINCSKPNDFGSKKCWWYERIFT